MYWTGRYFERAQALARALAGYERLSLDLPSGDALDLTPLLGLVGPDPEPDTKLGRHEVLRAFALDAENPSSVRGALGVARENLRSGRAVMPAAVWAPVNRLHARLGELDPHDTTAVFAALEEVEAIGSQIEGQLTSSMTQDAAFSFWCIGCRVERADMLLRVLAVLVPHLMNRRGEPFADVRAIGLLECVGAYSMFRRRNQTQADVVTILDFVLTDAAFPRSLCGLLKTIERELDALPRPGPVQAALASCYPKVLPNIGSSSTLLSTLDDLMGQVGDFAAVVAERYFPAEPRPPSVEPLAPRATRPAAADPFESLGREHAAVESVLRLLDEMTSRAMCGQAVERGAVRAIVDFFTDFGVLGHHEKEEGILMPVLLDAGFDWQEGPLAVMRRDHRQEHYFLRVLAHLSGQHGSWSNEDRRRFISVATELTQFLRAHMRLENREVFAPAAQMLSVQVKASLMEELTQFDAQTGGDVQKSLRRLDGWFHKYGIGLRASA
jgi:uncharacterized alpha-E superfamily protein/hemerythrin-like domain-containing protein